MRHNDRQRFAFTLAVQDLVHTRLTSAPHHLTKLALPLQTPLTEPHTPIFLSPDLQHKKRVLVLFGERDQDLGVLAHRVLGGKGGVNEGSVLSIVQALGSAEADEEKDIGVVLANTGESWWWPEGQRALSFRQSNGVRLKSAVHKGRYFDPRVNGIPGHTDVGEHVRMVFESVLDNESFVGKEARLEVIGLSEGAIEAEKYLDENWKRWEGRIGCLAILGGGLEEHEIKNDRFKKFLKEVRATQPMVAFRYCLTNPHPFTESPRLHRLLYNPQHAHGQSRREPLLALPHHLRLPRPLFRRDVSHRTSPHQSQGSCIAMDEGGLQLGRSVQEPCAECHVQE